MEENINKLFDNIKFNFKKIDSLLIAYEVDYPSLYKKNIIKNKKLNNELIILMKEYIKGKKSLIEYINKIKKLQGI